MYILRYTASKRFSRVETEIGNPTIPTTDLCRINSGAKLQKMEYGEYQVLIVPTHAPTPTVILYLGTHLHFFFI